MATASDAAERRVETDRSISFNSSIRVAGVNVEVGLFAIAIAGSFSLHLDRL